MCLFISSYYSRNMANIFRNSNLLFMLSAPVLLTTLFTFMPSYTTGLIVHIIVYTVLLLSSYTGCHFFCSYYYVLQMHVFLLLGYVSFSLEWRPLFHHRVLKPVDSYLINNILYVIELYQPLYISIFHCKFRKINSRLRQSCLCTIKIHLWN